MHRIKTGGMKMLLSVVVFAVLSTALIARADEVTSKRDRKLTFYIGTVHRPDTAAKQLFEKNCAESEREVQLNFDRITVASGTRASELWVKTWVALYYSQGRGRLARRHFMGYQCVLELESRARELGFVTLESPHLYAANDCIVDKAAKASKPTLAFQRIKQGVEKFGFGKDYCQVERIEVLPVYDGRSGD